MIEALGLLLLLFFLASLPIFSKWNETMETYHTPVIDSLMADKNVSDGQELISRCIVKCIHEISILNGLLLRQGQKKISNTIRGSIYEQVVCVVNHIIVLYHATDTEIPDEADLLEFSQDFPIDYANDGILLNFNSITCLTSIAANVFDSTLSDDPESEEAFMALLDVEESLTEMYAAVMILCELYELDFGEVLAEAGKREEWK